jgi:hypothetical protein
MKLVFNVAGQKEKLPDVEMQAKKAEVAQRRKMQVEKAEREQQVCFLLLPPFINIRCFRHFKVN